jgi:hypothetical protein
MEKKKGSSTAAACLPVFAFDSRVFDPGVQVIMYKEMKYFRRYVLRN